MKNNVNNVMLYITVTKVTHRGLQSCVHVYESGVRYDHTRIHMIVVICGTKLVQCPVAPAAVTGPAEVWEEQPMT